MSIDVPVAPAILGRGVVVPVDADVVGPWDEPHSCILDDGVLADPATLDAFVDQLHEHWVAREPVVVRWAIENGSINEHESWTGDVWSLNARFLFPLERLRVLLFANNYDARAGDPRWWFSTKAIKQIGATEGGSADVVLGDGTAVWVDGGPHQPIDAGDHAVISGEAVDRARTIFVSDLAQAEANGLADDQLAAVRHPAGPARVIAPAGSGKTRTLAARLRHLLDDRNISPDAVTAVAYNSRAATELRERAGAPRDCVRTVHSLGWAILREAHPGIGLLNESDVRRILDGLVHIRPKANADPMGPFLDALGLVRLGLRSPESVEADADDTPGFAAAFPQARQAMYRQGAVDYDEQIYGAIEALLADPHLRRRWQARCQHLLVDEFQDLTPAFLLLLRLLASPRLQVFGVGDDDQVIYGYSGADPSFLIDFDRYFPGAKPHALETNYRCPGPVVTAASTLLSYNNRRIDKKIVAGPSASSDKATLRVNLESGADLAVEAAAQITAWIDAGALPSDIAVLTRVNSSLIPVKAALVDAEISTNDQLGATALNRTMVRGLFAWLRIARRPDEMHRADILEAVKRPSRGLNRVAEGLRIPTRLDMRDLTNLVDQMKPQHETKWLAFVDDIGLVTRRAGSGKAARTIDAVMSSAKLAKSAQTLDASRHTVSKSSHEDDLMAILRAAAVHPDLDGFEAWLGNAIDQQSSADGVLLSSVHRVKGMEWPYVIVLGADRNSMPHKLAVDLEEERRVFHVAITRGQTEVVVLADDESPSRFIAEMQGTASREPEPAASRLGAVPGAARKSVYIPKPSKCGVGDRVAVAGGIDGLVIAADDESVTVETDAGANIWFKRSEVTRVLSSANEDAAAGESEFGEVNEKLADALREWRSETARGANVPAYVVCTNKTIEAIAALEPSDENELLAVPGIGPSRLENYGDDILAIVADIVAMTS